MVAAEIRYRITNTSGLTGLAWRATYVTLEAAQHALQRAMGWDFIYLSEIFSDGTGEPDGEGWTESDAVCAYATYEDRTNDGDGADAPRITRWYRFVDSDKKEG